MRRSGRSRRSARAPQTWNSSTPICTSAISDGRSVTIAYASPPFLTTTRGTIFGMLRLACFW